MRNHLKCIVMTLCALAGTAAAAPSAPDFLRADASLPPVDVIPFDFDSSQLAAVDRVQLQQAARWLDAHPRHRLVIEGNTDASGDAGYNAALAMRRANAVRAALIAQGIGAERVTVVVHGEAKPAPQHPTSAANRVVVLYATRS